MIPDTPYCDAIDLHVKGRITQADAARQTRTAREVLSRLARQPGVVLADEVGMGKTFVALAVAASVALGDDQRRPVVVMVPGSLKDKWPRDFALFRERCATDARTRGLIARSADSAVSFLKLLDDPSDRRSHIIFLTHGAMHRALTDGWVKLAVLQESLRYRHDVDDIRASLGRFAGSILRMGWVDRRAPEVWAKLLERSPDRWLRTLQRHGVDPERDDNPDSDDDPVPELVMQALRDMDLTGVFESLREIPRRESAYIDERLQSVRRSLDQAISGLWQDCIRRARFKLPLLVLDEAHHLKNAQTRFASLFQDRDASDDAQEVSAGPLNGVFERMLFLTATPFQLGHHELCSVLDRFGAVSWSESGTGKTEFVDTMKALRARLDAAQEAAVRLESAWGALRREDLSLGGAARDVEEWWAAASAAVSTESLSSVATVVVARYRQALKAMRAAEEALHPWVIRHIKPRVMVGPSGPVRRRQPLPGRAIETDSEADTGSGLSIGRESLLPFLLAARVTTAAPDERPVFAEGLASSYEAFLHTRARAQEAAVDADDMVDEAAPDDAVEWHLARLDELIPARDASAAARHPKIAATVRRVVDLWARREKVVVFCHFVATGRALRQHISAALGDAVGAMAAEKAGRPAEEAGAYLEQLGLRFFDQDSPVRRACDRISKGLVARHAGLAPHAEAIQEVIRRYLRTPAFIVRYFPLDRERLDEAAVDEAFQTADASGLTLARLIEDFLLFLEERCGERDREAYVSALSSIQTGSIGAEAAASFATDERQATPYRDERLLPNVRLVNGATNDETRRKLMLTFNTPFFPEVLVASSVLAEGVDLHLNCRHVIHHDLCWNPSTLEQRTGRVDRIGAKAERCLRPVRSYLPYVSETQDEKMYRVVTDRERWFNVVMGESFRLDARSLEQIAERVPLPAAAAAELAFRLGVV